MPCQHALNNLTILLVEDEQKLARLLRDAIGDHFKQFALAYDGKAGLEAARRLRPDMIITDITMPRMNGLEMSAAIRKIFPALPIVILSAYSEKEYLLKAIDAGITKYLIKPFDPDELLALLCAVSQKLAQTRRRPLMPPFQFDPDEQKLFRDNTMVRLSQREALFIDSLLSAPNRFLASGAIKERLWDGADISDERLRVFINRLRRKTHPDLIQNIVGQGYLLQTHAPEKQN